MSTRFGDTGPIFGLISESIGFIQEFNQKRAFDEAMVDDHEGSTVTYLLFNGKWEGSFTLIDKNGGTIPDAAVAATISNLATITKVILVDKDRKPEQKGFQKTTFTFKAWDSISL